jgi:rhodanese-related sulfurtransferase
VFVLEGGLPTWKQSGHEVESVQRIPRVAVKSVKVDMFRSWLAERKAMTIVDIRTENNFKEGHIEGAVNLPLYKLHDRYQELPYNRTLVLVDSRGFRTFLAQSYLKRKGFDVVRLFGGMEAWKAYELKIKRQGK